MIFKTDNCLSVLVLTELSQLNEMSLLIPLIKSAWFVYKRAWAESAKLKCNFGYKLAG